jgi:hypothetical protein
MEPGYDEVMRSTPPARLLRVIAPALLAAAALGCGPGSGASSAKTGPAPAVQTGTHGELERLFPLEAGHTYRYAVETDKGPDVWLARATRQTPERGALQYPTGTKQFEYTAEGVRELLPMGSVYLLRLPLALGNRWYGRQNSTIEIVAVNAVAELPASAGGEAAAQRFTGCVQTLETRGGDLPMRTATTFCPDVGIVMLEAASGDQMERAVLVSHSKGVDLGPDGVRTFKDKGGP